MPELEWIERYEVRLKREGWAVIHIDSKGFFGVVSDYGNYAYHWSAFGDDFKRFLMNLDTDYLFGKLSGVYVFDEGRTNEAIRRHILEARRRGGNSRQWARREWDLLANTIETEADFREWKGSTSIEEPWLFHRTVPHPQAMGFCEKIYPTFIEQLRAGVYEKETRKGA